MRIGELADRAGVSTRMLRHYENQGLLRPARADNGYRSYTEADVDRAGLVSSLVRSGLPLRLIRSLLADPLCAQRETTMDPVARHEAVRQFRVELERLDSKIACLLTSRTAVEAHLEQLSAHGI